jgi:hypothetical protein
VTTDALLIDIGGDTGALVVYASEEFVGHEIEIARAENPSGHPVHNVVRARRVCDAVVCAAVFPTLPAGPYVPHGKGLPSGRTAFSVVGGRVTEFDWPGHPAP